MATDRLRFNLNHISPPAKCDDPEMAEDPGESKVIKQLERTCRRLVSSEKGHGTSETLIKEAKHIAHKFFDLPCKEKDQDQLTPGAGYRGYKKFEKL
ncbi:hypothetical protein WN944_021277 [Citrus x changshan-huyou]|uniref:Non-haem dioxygenase N-terminal domain-containing protein n=1 Tax=Citrus x changshan-huyou TaxID=2935761 RepID=A0AAP0QV67_9ROSI